MYRIYIASRYSRRDEMRDVAEQMSERGFIVSSTWLQEDYPLNMNLDGLTPEQHAQIAAQDLEDITGSDIMVFFGEDQNNQPPRGGRHCEFGFALALGVRIYIVGERENIFHYMPDIKVVPNLEELWEVI